MDDETLIADVADEVGMNGPVVLTSADLDRLIIAAGLAPSGDNTQPWKLSVCLDPLCIEIHLDPELDRSPMNSGQRMSLIACGAAIQNVLLLARERGFRPRLELMDELPMDENARFLIGRVMLTEPIYPGSSEHAERIVSERTCNRRVYDARPVSPLILSELQDATQASHGIQTHWLTDRTAFEVLARHVGNADAVMFGERSMRSAFLANVRFDLSPTARATEGLSLASLEISKAQGTCMRTIGGCPDAIFRAVGGAAMFATHARRLIRSSSGLCLIAAEPDADHAEVRTGQTLQRAWLALTELGLAAQPMMSLMVLENAVRHGSNQLVVRLLQRGARVVVNDFRNAIRTLGISGAPRFLLRFGYAAAPTGRTGRRGDAAQ